MKERLSVLLLVAAAAFAASCSKPAADANAVRDRGLAYLNQGKYDEAIKAFDSAIAMKPDDADAWNSRGNALASKHETDRALQSYDSAIAHRPNSPFAYKNRGASFATKDDFDRAIKDFDQAITLKPDYAGAFNSRGFAYQLKGDFDRALQDYDRSIQLAPGSEAAFRNRANTRFILGRFADAAADFRQSLKLHTGMVTTPAGTWLDETGSYAVVWLHAANMRAGLDDAAELATNTARVDSTTWPGPVLAFFAGKLTADQLVAWAARAEPRLRSDQHCGSEFFAGQVAMVKKQPAEARKRFEETRATCSKRYTEHAAATADLARLGVTADRAR